MSNQRSLRAAAAMGIAAAGFAVPGGLGMAAHAEDTPPPPPIQLSVPPITPRPLAVPQVAPMSVAPQQVTRTFQVVSYRPRTTTHKKVLVRLDDDGMLRSGEDRAVPRVTTQFVTVRVDRDATASEVVKAINSRTGRVGDVRTTQRLRAAAKSHTVAWELAPKATPRVPFGPRAASPQQFLARS
ncbi:hypothetical protein [Gephyromycinifex aptenodytis]|uniref:hypothetical protein n=1 Tax=Gephyromycinifex aptenodytis TaxID=2716227 RepID=UPI001444DDA5|nr:hypothetical protein [Gephyromycinifex aptenodytis]